MITHNANLFPQFRVHLYTKFDLDETVFFQVWCIYIHVVLENIRLNLINSGYQSLKLTSDKRECICALKHVGKGCFNGQFEKDSLLLQAKTVPVYEHMNNVLRHSMSLSLNK